MSKKLKNVSLSDLQNIRKELPEGKLVSNTTEHVTVVESATYTSRQQYDRLLENEQTKTHHPNPFDYVFFSNEPPYTFKTEDIEKGQKLYTGHLILSLKAISPLHIVGTQIPEPCFEGHRIAFSRFYRQNNRPCIPGSSIKGMLRSFIEALTNGWVSVAQDKEKQYPKQKDKRHVGFHSFDEYLNKHSTGLNNEWTARSAIPAQYKPVINNEKEMDIATYLFGLVGNKHDDFEPRSWKVRFEDSYPTVDFCDKRYRVPDIEDAASFSKGEFGRNNAEQAMQDLCEAIRVNYRELLLINGTRIKDMLNALNALLKVANLYEKLTPADRNRINNNASICDLINKTSKYRSLRFADLSADQKSFIRRLNRLILEALYRQTPRKKEDGAFMGGAKPSMSNWWYFIPKEIWRRTPRNVRDSIAEFVGEGFWGRKFYYHQDPEACLRDYTTNWVDHYEYPLETMPPEQACSIRIDVRNLPENMLKLLCLCLCPGKMKHKIGYGKPYGYGTVEFTITDAMLREEKEAAWPEHLDDKKDEFKKICEIAQWSDELKSIRVNGKSIIDEQALQLLARILIWEQDKNIVCTYPSYNEFKNTVTYNDALTGHQPFIKPVNRLEAINIAKRLWDNDVKRTIHFLLYQARAIGYKNIIMQRKP